MARNPVIVREGWTFKRLGDGSVTIEKRLTVGQTAAGGATGFAISICLLPHEWVSIITGCARDVNEATLAAVRQLHLAEDELGQGSKGREGQRGAGADEGVDP